MGRGCVWDGGMDSWQWNCRVELLGPDTNMHMHARTHTEANRCIKECLCGQGSVLRVVFFTHDWVLAFFCSASHCLAVDFV